MAEAEKFVNIVTNQDGYMKHSMPLAHARMSGTIANILDDIVDDGTSDIPIPNIKCSIMKKVVDFCKHHPDALLNKTDAQQLELRTKPLEGWDQDFVRVPLSTLFEMILAANFLDLKPMLNITCKAVAEMIKGRTPEDIKKIFGVEGDFTQEEKDKVINENHWLEDPDVAGSGGGAPAPP
jgi:S-phase kinase-associated protein 1